MPPAASALPADAPFGSVEPRLFTPPLRELTPETSYGYDVITFAEAIGWPLDPWQCWAVIHLGELLPDGRPRFRKVLILVARQNGKSHLLKILGLYHLLIARVEQVLSMSNKFEYARALWTSAYETASRAEVTAGEIPIYRPGNNDPHMSTGKGSTWRICAANGDAGRSGSVDLLMIDELRQHHTYDAWSASLYTMNARPYGQLIATTNQGGNDSVVLDDLHAEALSGANARTGLFEWSAPNNARPDDPAAILAANPNVGHRIELADLVADGRAAAAAGGERLTEHMTEVLCVKVHQLKPGLDADAWKACGPTDEAPPVDLAAHRDRLALVVDVARDGAGVALAAAAVLDDGHVHTEIIERWESAAAMRAGLPEIVERVRPRALGWFPSSPTAAVMVELQNPRQRTSRRWPPRRVTLAPITTETTAVCMGLAELVKSGELRHNDDPLATTHAENAVRRPGTNGTFVFDRRGAGQIYALYALAGAVHLARTLPRLRPVE